MSSRETNQQRMWRAMRILRRFTLNDLTMQASTEDGIVTHKGAKVYCRYLEWAGYLRRPGKKAGRSRWSFERAVFILVRNSGPLCPQVTSKKAVYDPNTSKIVWAPPGSEMAKRPNGRPIKGSACPRRGNSE